MTHRANLNLQSIRACEQRAQEEELPGLAKLLEGLLARYERTLSIHQERYDLLSRRLFVGEERSLLRLCRYPLGPLPGINYDLLQSLADNVRQIADRFPLPDGYMTMTMEDAAAHWDKKSTRTAGTCGALQVKISPKDPDALLFTSMGGKSLFSISVQWGQTLASVLQEQALGMARDVLGKNCLTVILSKPNGSVLDPQQITPLMPREFHS
jgi:hypothetical protein